MTWDGDYPPGSFGAEMQRIERELMALTPDAERDRLLSEVEALHVRMHPNPLALLGALKAAFADDDGS